MDDIAIVNGLFFDGMGAPPRPADIAIRGDRIRTIGVLNAPARQIIDAQGCWVTPGFVDLHSHSDYSLHADPFGRSKLHQGVTTEVGGNCGYHAAPGSGVLSEARKREYAESMQLQVTWNSLTEYFEALEAQKPSINYAQQIGFNTLLSAVTDDCGGRPTARQLDQLQAMVRQQLSEGAIGLSYGLAYPPACFSSFDHLMGAAKVVADDGAFLSFHLRDEGELLLESIDEALELGRISQAAIHIGHLKTFRPANWHKIDLVLERLTAARQQGLRLTVDRYPHLAMNTQLKFILPLWALEGGTQGIQKRLRDPNVVNRLVTELHATTEAELTKIMISLVSQPHRKRLEGLFLDQAAGSEDPFRFVCELIAEEGESAFATFFGMSKRNLDRILNLEFAVVASDASIQAVDKQGGGGRPHPRCFDTFCHFLGVFCLEEQLFVPELGIKKMTSLPADIAQLTDRGRLAEGSFADVVILDPSQLHVSAEYENPMVFPSAVHHVIVNGSLTIHNGRHTRAAAGRILRRRA